MINVKFKSVDYQYVKLKYIFLIYDFPLFY
jgi:hypothetical protein